VPDPMISLTRSCTPTPPDALSQRNPPDEVRTMPADLGSVLPVG
jgi:hypothetical protein